MEKTANVASGRRGELWIRQINWRKALMWRRRRGGGEVSGLLQPMAFAAYLSVALAAPHTLQAAQSHDRFLIARKSTTAPPGSSGLCARYHWACDVSSAATVRGKALKVLATRINSQVNRQVREIEDVTQYGKVEHWALPTRRGGDCEDFVLLKKKLLIESGVAAETLLIATVLDRQLYSHAVLVMRTAAGDVVLDNLTNRILPWDKTGYTFLKMQNPRAPAKWNAILLGGIASGMKTGT